MSKESFLVDSIFSVKEEKRSAVRETVNGIQRRNLRNGKCLQLLLRQMEEEADLTQEQKTKWISTA